MRGSLRERVSCLKLRPPRGSTVNLAALDLRPWKRAPRMEMPAPSVPEGFAPSPPAGDWGRRASGKSSKDPSGRTVNPGCRLWLEGWDARQGACDILDLSPEGVTIAIPQGCGSRRGQRGQLLIGPVGGDHYALPVAVRCVKHSRTASIVELAFPDNEPWSYRRG